MNNVLIISTEVDTELNSYCSRALYEHVMDDFNRNGIIINDNIFSMTSINLRRITSNSLWVIDDVFFNEGEFVSLNNKISVIVAYINSNGCVIFNNELFSGGFYLPFLTKMTELGYISTEKSNEINDTWYPYISGETEDKPHFDLE